MARFYVSITALAASLAFFASLTTTPVHADVFTYQGELRQSGEPVTDLVDFRFRLFDAAAGGSQIGPMIEILDEPITDGRITADLDFGPGAFDNGEARWIDIQVRVPAGSGNYEALVPRQPVKPTPYAMFARQADVPFVWSGGNAFLGEGRVGIGTSAPISALEVFKTTNDWDGMWMRTTGVQSKAFYGFQAGSITAQQVLDAEANNWRLRLNGQDRMTVNATNGRVGIGTTTPAADLQVRGNGEGTVLRVTNGGPGGTAIVAGDVVGSGRAATFYGNTSNDLISVQNDGSGRAANFWGEVVFGGGSVGIGTTTPSAQFEVVSSTLAIRGIRTATSGSFPGVHGESNSTASTASGTRGWIVNTSPGSSSAGVWGRNMGTTNSGSGVRGTHEGGGYGVRGESESGYGGGFGSSFNGKGLLSIGETHLMGQVGINTTTPQDMLHVNGTTRTNVLRITAGSDLSERFDVSAVDEITPQPGMVVSIDPANPGRLILSTRCYDRTVAGVISGAGGINSGMIMGQEGSVADGDHPVALTGRVYVMVDATFGGGAIEPGDLLTTSDTPGHAMKVTDYARAQGAIIGKAMTPLAEGERGLVLVLIALQ